MIRTAHDQHVLLAHLLASRFPDDVNFAPDFGSSHECDLVEHVLELGVESAKQ